MINAHNGKLNKVAMNSPFWVLANSMYLSEFLLKLMTFP